MHCCTPPTVHRPKAPQRVQPDMQLFLRDPIGYCVSMWLRRLVAAWLARPMCGLTAVPDGHAQSTDLDPQTTRICILCVPLPISTATMCQVHGDLIGKPMSAPFRTAHLRWGVGRCWDAGAWRDHALADLVGRHWRARGSVACRLCVKEDLRSRRGFVREAGAP